MTIVWELQVIKYYQQYKEVEKQLIDNKDLFGALAHFRIARNFSGIREQEKKDELVAIINSVVLNQSLSSKQKYAELLDKFKRRYKKELVSATSKILWFIDSKQDFIIYDTLAVSNLRKHKKLADLGGKEKYFDFCDKWRELFAENQQKINKAVERTKDFYIKAPHFDDERISVMDEIWFRMRVMDMYLWNSN